LRGESLVTNTCSEFVTDFISNPPVGDVIGEMKELTADSLHLLANETPLVVCVESFV